MANNIPSVDKILEKVAEKQDLYDFDKNKKIPMIEMCCSGIEKKVAYMLATSHEYKKPNTKSSIKFVKNYSWELSDAKLKDMQGINKPVIKDRVMNIAKHTKLNNRPPLIVVNQLDGIRPQTPGKKILIDGHHRKEAYEFLGAEKTPVYKGIFNGKATKNIDDLLQNKAASMVIDSVFLYKQAALNSDVKLNPIQERVVNNPSSSMILAHNVGSGKTLSAIAKTEKLREQGKANKALVVVPASLRHNFVEEGINKFTNNTANIIGNKGEIKKGTGYNPNPDSDYNVISYEMFRKNPKDIIKALGADTLIMDESQKGKNEGVLTTNALKSVKGDVNNVLSLTGSVVSNSIGDIHPLLDIVADPKDMGGLGKNKKDFGKIYFKRSKDRKYKGLREERIPVTGFKNKKFLKEMLNKYVDYAGIDESRKIAKIPHKDVSLKKVPLTKEQARAYKGILKDNPKMLKLIKQKRLETLKDDEVASAFNSLIEARKLMNDYSTVSPGMSSEEGAKHAPKTQKLIDDMVNHLDTTKDGQAIILSNLIKGGIEPVEADLKRRGIDYGKFIGKGNEGVTEETRQQDIRDYKDRKKKVMLISGAGAEGLSLNDTTWEGVLDPHYNPERMNQMEARGVRAYGLSHRPEEDRRVAVNRYVATMPKKLGIIKSSLQTPDEFIYQIANNKDKQNQLLFKLLEESKKKR